MRITRLVIAEILGRPLNFLLCLLVIIAAAVLFMVARCALAVIIATIAVIAIFNVYTFGKAGRISDIVQGK